MLGHISNNRAQIQATNSERVGKLRRQGFYVAAPKEHHPDYNKDNYEFKTCSTYLELQALKQNLGRDAQTDYDFLNPIGC
jgi:hypothetical protein